MSYSIQLTDERSGKPLDLVFGGVYKSRLVAIRQKLSTSEQ
jgi:hypothetical protein